MTRTLLLLGLALTTACSAGQFTKTCDMDADQKRQALVNIRQSLETIPYIKPEQYLNDEFSAHGDYGGKNHCVFLIKPWQPIVSEFIWDGTFAFKVDKQTLEVIDYFRVDEG